MTRMTLRLPDGVLGMADRDADWAAWVDLLPRRVADLLDEWELGVDGLLMHGFTALVVPVLRSDGGRAVVKLRFPGDDESEFEHLALRQWNGNGAVRLIRADPARAAMLLERIGPEDLNVVGDLEACEEIARIYARIHGAHPAPLRRADAAPGSRTDQRPRYHRHPDPRRSALRQRARRLRRPAAVAGDRPEADVG
jgi:streptomycin 6-kinase